MDFVHPAVVQRLIANTLGAKDCGIALLCLDSGGCFASDLHDAEDVLAINGCADRGVAEVILMDYAEDRWVMGRLIIYYSIYFAWLATILCCCYRNMKTKDQSLSSMWTGLRGRMGGGPGGGDGGDGGTPVPPTVTTVPPAADDDEGEMTMT